MRLKKKWVKASFVHTVQILYLLYYLLLVLFLNSLDSFVSKARCKPA